MWLVIGIVLFLVGIISLNNKTTKSVEEALSEADTIKEKLDLKGSLIKTSYIKYCGGYPLLNESKIFKINIYEDAVVLYNNKHTGGNLGDGLVIKREDISKVSMIDQTQIINNPKFANMLLFGVSGLGIGNKDVNELYYLNIDYMYNNKKLSLLLSSDIEKELGSLYGVIETKDSLNRTTQINSAINRIMVGENSNSGMINVL